MDEEFKESLTERRENVNQLLSSSPTNENYQNELSLLDEMKENTEMAIESRSKRIDEIKSEEVASLVETKTIEEIKESLAEILNLDDY